VDVDHESHCCILTAHHCQHLHLDARDQKRTYPMTHLARSTTVEQ
jgi:hypothetical protein